MCVSGTTLNNTKTYTDNNHGTVTHLESGLIWQKCNLGENNDSSCSGTASTVLWNVALSSCNSLSLKGKTWRLPNILELNSIVDRTIQNPASNTTVFPTIKFAGTNYASSTTYTGNALNDFTINFSDGAVSSSIAKTTAQLVKCVSN